MKINYLIILISLLGLKLSIQPMAKNPLNIIPQEIWFEIIDKLGVNKNGKDPKEIFANMNALNLTSKKGRELIQQYAKTVCEKNGIKDCNYNKFKALILDKIVSDFDKEIEKQASKIKIKRSSKFSKNLNDVELKDEKIPEKIKIAENLNAPYWINSKFNSKEDKYILNLIFYIIEYPNQINLIEFVLKAGLNPNRLFQKDPVKDKTILDLFSISDTSRDNAKNDLITSLMSGGLEGIISLLLKYGANVSDTNIKDLQKVYSDLLPDYLKNLDKIIKQLENHKK